MLFVRERHTLPKILQQNVGNRVIGHRETEDLWRHSAGGRDHCQLSLPGFAEPSLLGKLLYVSRAVAGGINVAQRHPSPEGKNQNWHYDDHYEQNQHPAPPSSVWSWCSWRLR